MLIAITLFFTFSEPQEDLHFVEVLLLEPAEQDLSAAGLTKPSEAWLEVSYFAGKEGKLIHHEDGEKLWWIGDFPLMILGGTGEPLPKKVLNRASVYVEVYDHGGLIAAAEIHPRAQSIRLNQDEKAVAKAIQKGGSVRYTASYLSDVANYMAGNSATVSIDADSYAFESETIIDGRGIKVDATTIGTEWTPSFGIQMMLSGYRGAFRAGKLNDTSRWTGMNLGLQSAAFGENTLASGNSSFAAGYYGEATNTGTVSMGWRNLVHGVYSTSFGFENTIQATSAYSFLSGRENESTGDYVFGHGQSHSLIGDYSVAFGSANSMLGSYSAGFGSNNSLNQSYSLASGFNNTVSGSHSLASGDGNNIIRDYSLAIGRGNAAVGHYSAAIGRLNEASYNALAVGRYNDDNGAVDNWIASDPLFTVGNGSSTVSRHNAFEVSKDGFTQVRREVDGAGVNPTHYVVSILNEETTSGGDVLALSVSDSDPNAASNFIAFFDADGVVGEIDGNGSGGVSYKSSSADFAEYFDLTEGECVEPGDLVGFRKGKVTKNIDGLERVFVISSAPLLVGNHNPDTNHQQALVALMGQVPIKVIGEVLAGDLLVADPSGAARTQKHHEDLPIIGMALQAQEHGKVQALVGPQWTSPKRSHFQESK